MSFTPIYKIRDWLPPITENTYCTLIYVRKGKYGYYKKKYIQNSDLEDNDINTYWELERVSNSNYNKEEDLLKDIFNIRIENDIYSYLDNENNNFLNEAIITLDNDDNDDEEYNEDIERIIFYYRKTEISKYISYNCRAIEDIEKLNLYPPEIILNVIIKQDSNKLIRLLEKKEYKNNLYLYKSKYINNDIDFDLRNNINCVEFIEKNKNFLEKKKNYGYIKSFVFNKSYLIKLIEDYDYKNEYGYELCDLCRNPNAVNILKKIIPYIYYNQNIYESDKFKNIIYNLSKNPNCVEILTKCKFNVLDNFSINKFIDWESFLEEDTYKNYLYIKYLIDTCNTEYCFSIQGIGDMENYLIYLLKDEIDKENKYTFRTEYKSFINPNGYDNKFQYNFVRFWKIVIRSKIGFRMFESVIREIDEIYCRIHEINRYSLFYKDICINPLCYNYINEALTYKEYNKTSMSNLYDDFIYLYYLIHSPNVQIFKLYYNYFIKKEDIDIIIINCFKNYKNKWCDEKIEFLEELIDKIFISKIYMISPIDFWQKLFMSNYDNLLPFINKHKDRIIPNIDKYMITFSAIYDNKINYNEQYNHCSLFIEFIESNIEEIFKQDKMIPIYALYSNKYIYKLDKIKMMEQCKLFAEELTAYVFNPNRLKRFSKRYNINFDILIDIY